MGGILILISKNHPSRTKSPSMRVYVYTIQYIEVREIKPTLLNLTSEHAAARSDTFYLRT